jgi:hypothetical protein
MSCMNTNIIADPTLAASIAEHWNRGPVVFRDVLREPLFNLDEFMRGVKGTAAAYIKDPSNRAGRIFVEGEVIKPSQIPSFMPRGDSETFPEYINRLRSLYPNDFSIILANCEAHIPVVRDRLTPLLHGLFSRVGYPVRRNHACIYAGTYRATPFGIHRDDCHVLMFSGVGRKAMAFWPRPYFEVMKHLFIDDKLHARATDHIATAATFEIGPLDVLYWPAGMWHISLNQGTDFHAALSMGIYHRGSNAESFMALDFLPRVSAKGKLSESERYDELDLDGYGASITSNGQVSAEDIKETALGGFFEHWDRVRDQLNRSGEREYRALAMLVSSLSSAGFGEPFTLSSGPQATVDNSMVQCVTPEGLVTSRARDGVVVGANGKVLFYGAHLLEIENTITILRGGRPVLVHEVLESVDESARPVVGGLIRDLLMSRAISIVELASA